MSGAIPLLPCRPSCHGKLYITVEVFLNKPLEDPTEVESRTATFCGYENHVLYSAYI